MDASASFFLVLRSFYITGILYWNGGDNVSEEIKDRLYVQGVHYDKILEIMKKQLDTRSGLGKDNLEIYFKELLNTGGDNISQVALNGITESLLFEIENN